MVEKLNMKLKRYVVVSELSTADKNTAKQIKSIVTALGLAVADVKFTKGKYGNITFNVKHSNYLINIEQYAKAAKLCTKHDIYLVFESKGSENFYSLDVGAEVDSYDDIISELK